MKFTIKNTGVIKKAEIEFGDLTILCGKNNTGKTYITYNAFNYIDAIRYYLRVTIDSYYTEQLLEKGKISISLEPFFHNINQFIKTSMTPWVNNEMARQMAAHEDLYDKSEVSLFVEKKRQDGVMEQVFFDWSIQVTKDCKINLTKEKKKHYLDVLLLNSSGELPDHDLITRFLENSVISVLKVAIPELFVITCERTGAAAFRTNFVISRLVSSKQDNIDQKIAELYQQMDFRGHPRPMNKDLEFVGRFDDAIQQKGYIAKEHPEILAYFSTIVGGEYRLVEPNIVTFVPAGTNTGLTMLESSSSVRSLMELNFYLKHKSKYGQCLIIDEPELNLHPENQRKMARLLAMLVNSGLYVAITTHSDYIIREFNTLIMLHDSKSARLQEIAKELNFDKNHLNCLLSPSQVRCYVAKEGTVKQMDVNKKYGIEVTSFDDSIREVNALQRRILYGE